MADPSETQSTNSSLLTFRFKIREAKTFKLAISALTDSEFNPNSTAVIGVGSELSEIVVRKKVEPGNLRPWFNDHIVYGILVLAATHLAEYECNNPLRKTVNLTPLLESLADVADNDAVTVYHRSNTPDILYFEFGSASSNSVQLTLIDECFGPRLNTPSAVALPIHLPTIYLKALTVGVLHMAPEQCPDGVTIKDRYVLYLETGRPISALEREFLFMWRYWRLLMKASDVAEECAITIARLLDDESVRSVIISFKFEVVGFVLIGGRMLAYPE